MKKYREWREEGTGIKQERKARKEEMRELKTKSVCGGGKEWRKGKMRDLRRKGV